MNGASTGRGGRGCEARLDATRRERPEPPVPAQTSAYQLVPAQNAAFLSAFSSCHWFSRGGDGGRALPFVHPWPKVQN